MSTNEYFDRHGRLLAILDTVLIVGMVMVLALLIYTGVATS